ncbi:MAG: response regulator, partial [Phycisphaeraceae bacterium]
TLVAVLSRAGYQVSEASRAEHALALIADPASQFHLLITDLSMPDVNGIELAQRVRALPVAIPIIVTTGYFSDSHRLQLSQLSDSLLLPKPYLREELLGMVRKALALGRD